LIVILYTPVFNCQAKNFYASTYDVICTIIYKESQTAINKKLQVISYVTV